MSRTGTLFVGGLVVLAAAGATTLGGAQPDVALAEEVDESTMSREWIGAMLSYGEPGVCHLKSPMYHWRDVGWGSNMNRKRKSNAPLNCLFISPVAWW